MKITASSRSHATVQRFSDAGNSAAMAAWEHYIIRLDQEAENLAKEAARAELVVEEKRELYLEASRELKAIEKLKEKREKEHRKEMFAAETAELDTIPGRRRGEE
jgi:flagellar export protein FliJ